MIIANMWENKSDVPNHQPAVLLCIQRWPRFGDPAGPQTTDAWEVFAGLVRSGFGRGGTSGPAPGSVEEPGGARNKDDLPSGSIWLFSHGKSAINGGFYGKISYFYGPFFYHGYVSQNSRGWFLLLACILDVLHGGEKHNNSWLWTSKFAWANHVKSHNFPLGKSPFLCVKNPPGMPGTPKKNSFGVKSSC